MFLRHILTAKRGFAIVTGEIEEEEGGGRVRYKQRGYSYNITEEKTEEIVIIIRRRREGGSRRKFFHCKQERS